MNAERWRQVETAFQAAVRTSGPERLATLDQACAGDVELRAEVESLLIAHDRSSSFIESPAFELGARSRRPAGMELEPGECVGRYTIRRLLGRGGMAVVYEAEQEHPRRKVALKLLRPGRGAPDLIRRLEREASLLARLNHPGIARIFDAGTTETPSGAQPFLAMEIVAGQPITAYVRGRALSLRKRLGLFVETCRAVQHAHEKAVLHRDLKPGNILVGEDGRPRVLDFGIARSIAGDAQTASDVTEPGLLIGTLAYMSPEQIHGDHHQLDTRSDVYALGVLLFELVTDRLPYDLTGRSIVEAGRIILETRPPPVRSSRRGMFGDLDTIAQKALEKDRSRRYSSADALADDIQRLLDHRPILARPPSLGYQTRLFVRRHPAITASVVVGAVCLLGGALSTTVMWLKAKTAADLAIRQKTDKEFINEFLISAFHWAAPEIGGREQTVRQLLDVAAANLENRPGTNPHTQADLHFIVGDAYEALTVAASARDHFKRAHELRVALLGEDDAETLDAERRWLRALGAAGQVRDSLVRLRELMNRSQSTLGPQHPVTTAATIDLVELTTIIPASPTDRAQMRSRARQINDLLSLAESALMTYEQTHDNDEDATVAARNVVARLYADLRDFARAAELLGQSIAEIRTRPNPDPRTRAMLADSLGRLAECLVNDQRVEEADAAITEAIEIDTELRGPDHGQTLMHRGERLRIRRGQVPPDEVEAELRALLAGKRAFFGEHHQSTAGAAIGLGQFLEQQDRLEEAVEQYSEAHEIVRAVNGAISRGRMNVLMRSLSLVTEEQRVDALIADVH
ncbi:MAG: hypothetical protein AMXMBFR47_39040 [Planctomycetota bacterium]